MSPQDTKERVLAAHKLLFEETTSRAKFESIRTLIQGLHPKIDELLSDCSHALSDIEKLQQGELIELSAEKLPENSEEEKERKKRLLLFVRTYKDLRSEVERVKNELEQHSENQSVDSASRILAGVKGPFGLVTLAAVIIVGTVAVITSQRNEPAPVESSVKGETSEATASTSKIQVIEVNGKKVALSETVVGIGPECDNVEHYHAKDHVAARAIDGTMLTDPGGCGFGKVKEVNVLEMEQQ